MKVSMPVDASKTEVIAKSVTFKKGVKIPVLRKEQL